MTTYEERGVSPHKPDVKNAVSGISTNLFPGAFCWVVEDVFNASPDQVFIMHADGAGTKSILAYIHYKETGDASVFKGIARDSLAMNINDLIAVGATGPYILSNTIGRNAKLIPGEIVKAIIDGYAEQCELLNEEGISITIAGGETADLGDVVRTLIVDATLSTSMARSEVIDISRLQPGTAIVGLASYGRATYETAENSGIGTNGFSSLRHELLSSRYLDLYPETFAPEIREVAYQGRFLLNDCLPGCNKPLGDYLLSPTRIYAPVVKALLSGMRPGIKGIINNSGGGQTKCLNFGEGLHYRKHTPVTPPPIFDFIKNESKLGLSELARTYNLGSILEIYCDYEKVNEVIRIAQSYGIHAQLIGEVVPSANRRELTIDLWGQSAHWKE